MPQDPVIERQEVVPGAGFGQHDQVLVQRHIAPSSSEVEGASEFDPYHDADMAICRQVRAFLLSSFPTAYSWLIESDIKQGIVKFNIPVLMGLCDWYVISLRTHGTNEAFGNAVIRGAGEILERYALPRDRFDVWKFLEARANNSILISPWKKVPN